MSTHTTHSITAEQSTNAHSRDDETEVNSHETDMKQSTSVIYSDINIIWRYSVFCELIVLVL